MKLKILALVAVTTLTSFGSADLYKKCAGCHGANGEISAFGKTEKITGQDVNKTVTQLTAYRDSGLNKYALGAVMKSQVSCFTDEDIKSLALYIKEMK